MKLPAARYDVAIAGAGIAGSSLGCRLARQGLRVLLVDRASFPRPKLCGEGLMPAGVGLLQSLFAAGGRPVPRGPAFSGLRIWSTSPTPDPLDLDFNAGRVGWVVSRLELDAALLELAIAGGVDFRPGFNVLGIEIHSDGRDGCLSGSHGRKTRWNFSARLLVDAAGVSSRLHVSAGIGLRSTQPRCAAQLTAGEFRGKRERVEIFCGSAAEAYVAPFAEGARVTFLLDPDQLRGDESSTHLRDRLLSKFPGLAGRVSGLSEIRGAVPITRRLRQTSLPGLLLAGDAGGACDPINGQGMTIALRDGELIADLVAEIGLARPAQLASEYARRRRRYFDPAYELALTLRTILGSPFLTRRLARRLQRNPDFALKVSRLATEGATPHNRVGILERIQLLAGL